MEWKNKSETLASLEKKCFIYIVNKGIGPLGSLFS